MKMGDLNLEEDIVNVVAEEALVIVDVLSRERNNVLEQIYGLVEQRTRDKLQSLPCPKERAVGIVEYFKDLGSQKCGQFLYTMWMFCQNIPMDLETKVLSVVGASNVLNKSYVPDVENSPRPRNAKRACIDHVESYTNSVKLLLQQKFEKVTKDIVKKVSLDKTWLCLKQRNSSRMRDKSAPVQDREELSEHKESVESLLKTTGRLVVLLGQAGSGKTLLMHCLAHNWAQGSYPSIKLLFLLEFRQLNLVLQPLSLMELLFRFFLQPEGGDEQSEAIFNYILSNPEKICFIFDGYDEFGAKFTDPEKLPNHLGPRQQLPVADLLSGICSYKILPKCTVLVTCRPRDVIDTFGTFGYFVAELLGFSQQRLKEYTEEYFHEKGSELKEKAVSLLTGNRHLLSMSHIPALCHVCCVCLDHILSKDTSKSPVELPVTLTQIYLQILSAYLSRSQDKVGSENTIPLLRKYRCQIAELSRHAMNGLEKSRIVFLTEDLSTELMNFGANAGILSRVDLIFANGFRSLGCAFMHLTMQEFLSALHLMSSPDITEAQLKRKLNLKSRWTAKSDPKTVFTDSLHLFMCGLAAKACTSSLALLEGSEDAWAVVKKRQSTILKILRSFVGTAAQTGPKIIELCRCAHETQDISLAKAVGSRTRFEMRNIRLSTVDMDALAFVTSAADQMVCLDFGGCSIELECLSIIPDCKNLEHLIFRSRKYDDKFAEALSSILPKLQNLKQLHFISGGLTDIGAEKVFQALQQCAQITHLNMSDNSLTDEGVRMITSLFPKLESITSVMLGKNNISRDGIFILVEKMSSINIKKIHVMGKKEISIFFSSNSHTPSMSTDVLSETDTSKELILNSYDLKLTHLTSLHSKLRSCSSLTILNLSHNSLGNTSLKKLLQLSKIGTIQEIDVSYNGVDMEGLVLLSASLCTQKNLREIEASHNGEQKLILKFTSSARDSLRQLSTDGSDLHLHKKFSLTHSDVQPTVMKRLCKNLAKCQHLLELDFSHGSLKDESIEELLIFLPDIKCLVLLNLCHVQMSTDGSLLLVKVLNVCQRATAVDLRPQGEAFIKFLEVRAEAATCKFTQYKLNCENMEKLSGILMHCQHLADLDLSSNLLRDEGITKLLGLLPRLQISNSLSLNNNKLTQLGVLDLVNSLNTCKKVAAVEISLGAEEQILIRFEHENVLRKTLSLRECGFETSHWLKLVEILNGCPSQLKLELSSNALHTQNPCSLLSTLVMPSSIQTLELRNNGLNVEVIKHLVKQMSIACDYKTIRVEEPWIKAEAAVCLVSCCLDLNPQTKEIRVEKNSFTFTVESLPSSRALCENGDFCLSSVHAITFDDCEVEGQNLSSLQTTVQKCSSLLELHFSQMTMGTHGAEFLSAVLPCLENLKSLSLHSKGETVDASVIFALKHMQNLERLSLSHHVISDSVAAGLGSALQSLTRIRSLNLSHCTGWKEDGGLKLVQGLVKCLLLEEIRLDLDLDQESTVCLARGLHNMHSLKKISLNKISKERSVVLCLLASLQSMSGLEEIQLEGLRMGDEGIEELVKYIPKWTTLQKLNLAENCMSDQAGEKLVKALSQCRMLQQLHLFRNNLGNGFAVQLGRALPSLTLLSELNLSENQMDLKGSTSLCEGLSTLKALKKLCLTSIGTSDLNCVASCLKHCTSIESISLAWNKCGNDMALKLADVLPQCSKLKKIDLEANNITLIGAKALAKSLQSCPWIEIIRLWRNPIVKDDQILRDQRMNFSPT
ncbi:NLR family, CARD domain containing 5 isoform X2 [Hoplias malabaricus]|uniref:NLR family, CARD domain containing 5 isoform X2 n=1 Tax=Hoplias malabaricus TaxID=27720 RepID=UPI003462152B